MGIVFGLRGPILACSIDPKYYLVTTKIEIFWWNFGNFFKIGTRDLTILGAKKVVFLTFWKLVLSYSEVVWALFSALKGPILVMFLARKVDIWPLKSKFMVKIWPSESVILTILGLKKVVLWSFWKMFWRSSEVVWASFWALNGPLSGVFIARKVDICPLKSKF